MPLINTILDTIEHYNPKFFSDSNLKILDPASGIGNYPVALYQRLCKGLKKTIPDVQKRKKHILENMLSMIELN